MKSLFIVLTLTICGNILLGQTNLSAAERANFNRQLNKGIESFEAGRTNEALELLKRAEILDPDFWKLNYWMAACHYELTSFNTAQSYINNAIRNLNENDEADAALKQKIRSAFSIFDRENRNACDVREVLACNFGMLFKFNDGEPDWRRTKLT